MNKNNYNFEEIETDFMYARDAINAINSLILSVEPDAISPRTITEAASTARHSADQMDSLFDILLKKYYELSKEHKDLRELINANKRIENKFPGATAQIMQEELDKFRLENNIQIPPTETQETSHNTSVN